MNHPLSRNELSAGSNDSESPEGTPVPSWLTQHYRDDDAEFLVNQYRRKQDEEPAASPPPENRTYEYYRRRIMERQREQLDLQMERAPMPRVPSRPTIPVIFAPMDFAYCKAVTRFGLMFFSIFPPPTENTTTPSFAASLLTLSHSTKIDAQPSSLVRAVSSDTLSVGA